MRALFLLVVTGCQAAFPIEKDSGIDAPTPDAGGLWCGIDNTSCAGTCCVKVGNGYSFECRALGDKCSGFDYAFSCDRTSDCPGADYCCYSATESHCGSCNQMQSMCLYPTDDCPENTVCRPWFSAYGKCF